MEDAVEPDTSSGGGAGAYPVFDDKLLTPWMDVSTEETGITAITSIVNYSGNAIIPWY